MSSLRSAAEGRESRWAGRLVPPSMYLVVPSLSIFSKLHQREMHSLASGSAQLALLGPRPRDRDPRKAPLPCLALDHTLRRPPWSRSSCESLFRPYSPFSSMLGPRADAWGRSSLLGLWSVLGPKWRTIGVQRTVEPLPYAFDERCQTIPLEACEDVWASEKAGYAYL